MDLSASNTTDLWWLDLDEIAAKEPNWTDCLSQEELTQALRFAFPSLQQRYRAVRASLRLILASYCRELPQKLTFVRSDLGKPALAGGSGIEFSLSHSGGTALLAVEQGNSNSRPVGVDLEFRRSGIDWLGISNQVFHLREQAAVEAWGLPAFFSIWTRKEAWLKALGTGWTEQAKQVCVLPWDWAPEQPAILQITETGGTWWVSSLCPTNADSNQWAAALCQSSTNRRICWRSSGELQSLWDG